MKLCHIFELPIFFSLLKISFQQNSTFKYNKIKHVVNHSTTDYFSQNSCITQIRYIQITHIAYVQNKLKIVKRHYATSLTSKCSL